MTRDLDTVVELQEALDDLAEAELRLHGVPDWMRELHDEHAAGKLEIEELETIAEEARLERRQADADIANAQEKLKHFQQQIGQVSTQREYGALLKEIDTVKVQISEIEDRGLAAMERREAAEGDIDGKREAFQELDERYGVELAIWEEEKPEVARRVETLQGRISVLREHLSESVLSQFERTLARHENHALAAVSRAERTQMWHCGSCNYRVRPQVVVEIHSKGSIVYCESCKRILFLELSDS